MQRFARWCLVAVMSAGLVLAGCVEEDTDVEAEGEEEVVEAPEDTVSPEVELDDLRREYERAYSEQDDPALAALRSKDYLEINAEGQVVREGQAPMFADTTGQDTTEQGRMAADTIPTAAMPGDLTLETESMTVAESGDVAYGTGTSTLRGTGPDGTEFTVESRWLAGFEKVDGEWKIDRLMTSTPREAEMTETGGTAAGATETDTTAAGADTTATTM